MCGGLGVADVKVRKGIPPKEDLLDNISRLEFLLLMISGPPLQNIDSTAKV